MDTSQIELTLPERWYIRETENRGILVIVPPDNPGSASFRPSVVISTTSLGARTIDQDIDLGMEQLGSVLGPLERSPVEVIDTDHAVNRYSYVLDGTVVQVTEFRSVTDGLSLNVTASTAADDGPEPTEVLEGVARSVHLKGSEPWPASRESVRP